MHCTKKVLASELTATARAAGYQLLYSVYAASPRTAGVAILVANDVWHGVVQSHTHIDASGRLLCVHLKWKGHSLWFVNVYVPSSDGPGARNFLQQQLAQVLQNPPAAQAQPVAMGDWNFVHSAALDRKHINLLAETQNDNACRPVFPVVAPGMVDTFRAKHPGRRTYTYSGPFGVARLDRVYVRDTFLPFITKADVVDVCEYISDHRPVVVHIAAAEGVTRRACRPGVRKLRMSFWLDEELQNTFQLWMAAQVGQAPVAAADLLLWWPAFKVQLAAKVEELNALHRQRCLAPAALRAEYDELVATVQAGWDAMQSATTAAERDAACQAIHAHRCKLAATLAALRRHSEHVQPLPPWIPQNEVPGTKFTAIMAPPAASKAVHALRHPHGHLLGPGVGQANLMVQHYAAISTAPAPQPAALQQVLQAIPAHGPVGLPPAAADALGDSTVTVAEVRQALRHSKPGTCPGFDGIPVELYRKAGQPMLQLLARVFSAVADTATTPSNFLDGVVTSIFKEGDPTLPSNYRPITLLNTDYRILAKVLANRCLQHIPPLISAEQCAFLKGRSIGDSIMLLQLLPHQLAAEGRTGALVAFLDFRKAYDSVSREFLREVLLAIGVGDKFVAWVMLLLNQEHTRACAVLNGYKSVKVHFVAGVRQGCPLSPLLYLFVGEALLRFIKAQPALGVTLAGGRVVAAQYADDIDPVLQGPEAVPVLVDTLSTFARASNQHSNVDKCKLLPVGRPSPAPVPDSIAGIPVVDAASTLGITFHAGLAPPTPKRDWNQLLSGVKTKLDKLGRLSLSAFGRAMGASTYALSRLLFYMEFAGLPAAGQLADLERALAKLVDRGNKSNAFTYVRKELLVGRVKEGGFGLLHVQQHVLARHAVLAVRLLTGDAAVPWICVGQALLSRLWGPGWHPLLPLLPEAQHVHAAADDTRVAPMPAPLARLFHALHQLPSVRDVAGGLQAQPWLCSAPLIGNPWLRNDQGHSLGRGASAIAVFFGCCTVGGLAHMCRTLATVSSEEWQRGPWGMVRRDRAWEHIQRLLQYVPRAWLDVAMTHAAQQPQGYHRICQAAVQTLLNRLGWWARDPGRMMPRPVPMAKLTVRVAYKMLIQPNIDMRRSRWADFIAEAYGVQPDQVQDAQLSSLKSLLAAVWHRVKWSNKHKVLFWQLTVYGLPTCANRNIRTSCFCAAAGHECPGRKHHMWDCIAAQAVVSELCTCLGIANAGLQRHHLWLMEMPLQMMGPVVGNVPGLRRVLHEVWMVVCLAALRAMWSTAKKVMQAESRARMAANPRGIEVLAAETAVICFWDLLHDFCESGSVPAEWRQLLLPGTPFLHVTQVGGAVVVNNGAD
jgi:exonuclease III